MSYPGVPAPAMPYGSMHPGRSYYGAHPGMKEQGETIPPWQLSSARKRVNIYAVLLGMLVPLALFTGVYALLSFQMRFEHPQPCYFLVGCGALIWIFLVAKAFLESARQKYFGEAADNQPTWFSFLAISCFVAWFFAVIMGNLNFAENLQPYYDLTNLNTYNSLSPTDVGGKGLMDAGAVYFAEGTQLDRTKALGFKDEDTYCVVPITTGNATHADTLASYDFWAVGVNCCNGFSLDFHCGDSGDPKARAGLRLMDDTQRTYFRLAVQQAEAAYGIKAIHPIFFHWVEDPLQDMNDRRDTGIRCFIVGCLVYVCFQFLTVAMLLLYYTRSNDWWFYRHWDRNLGGPSQSLWRSLA
eukprot:gnl/TRDRNA2_/TRDRNA2_178760_c0_seq1.p1 gnl/TRDRNA2_/TRDRNA2_178760_c0~~gnl/TRDRNA2_/TRDRNA2_178760_c0_seq1.p1  ORF type:complete len:355 (-),score=51.14 gnl/TRDRNA2_/TRDRNA2_178760_c0_seq1:107-1171(-)